MTSQIGFIGLGIMGRGMVKNLVEKKFSVTVWNRTEAKAEALKSEMKVTVAGSPRELGPQAATCLLLIA